MLFSKELFFIKRTIVGRCIVTIKIAKENSILLVKTSIKANRNYLVKGAIFPDDH
jgi:hypothetical protein